MIVVLRSGVSKEGIREVSQRVLAAGFRQAKVVRGDESTTLNCLGKLPEGQKTALTSRLEGLPQVAAVTIVTSPLRLTSRSYHPPSSLIRVNGCEVGGKGIVVIAGPCAVEGQRQILAAAKAVHGAGAAMLRGGAFKPRTSPYEFQGLGEKGLRLLALAKQATGLPIVTEVMGAGDVPLVAEYADILQVGARNMQNYPLLERLGRTNKPVLLKRGPAATLKELLSAAEYVMAGGNPRVILCLRGVGGALFAAGGPTRNLIDLGDIPELKRLTHLPVIFDPSHACGRRDLIIPISRAAIAAGADGLMIEVHPNPDKAKCDGAQSLNPQQFAELMVEVGRIAKVMGRA